MLAKSGLTSAPWRRGILTFVMSLGLAVCPLTLAAQSVTFAWNPNPGTNVAGYMLYYGTDGVNFDSQMDAGTNTTCTVTGLESGSTNYFEVVAYDTNGDQSLPSNQIEYTIPAVQTVTVQANPANAGSVTGGGSFAAGSSATVTATANSGYTFANWTVNGSPVSALSSYSFTLTTNINLVANFTANPVTYTVAVSASPSAGGTVSGGGMFASGSSATVTATASSGYTFTNWTVNGSAVSALSSYSFTLTTNINLVANFTANPVTYTIAVSASPSAGGTVSGGGTFASGSSQTVTATASTGYTFTNWTVNGSAVGALNKYSFTLTTNINLVANFTASPVTYTIAVSASPSAGGTVGGGGTFASGSSATVTATASSGYTFTNWTVNGSPVSALSSYSFTVATNVSLVANFTANPVTYTIAVSASPSAGGTVSGGGTFASGSSATVTATASAGYTFTNWTVNGSPVSALNKYSFTLTTNINLVANFTASPVTYTIAVSASPSAGGTVGGGGTFASGSSQTVTATASASYTFSNWTVNGSAVSALSSYSFTVATNVSLVANFTASSNTTMPIPLVNGSFESPAGAQGTVAGVPDGWLASNNNPYGVYNPAAGIYTNEADDILPSPAQGSQVLWMDGSNSVAQILTNTLAASQTYTLSGAIGNRGDRYGLLPTDQVYVDLVAGDTIIAEIANVPHPGPGGFLSWTISYTTPATGFPSGPLQIRLGQNGAGEVNFDNITLTTDPASSTNATAAALSADDATPATAQANASANFTLLISGNGTLAPSHTTGSLQEGKTYTLTAIAAKGSVFAGWASNGIVMATTPHYSFLVESNLVLQANFVTNPFIPVVGTYHGLFYVPNDAGEESSGAITATVTSAGAFSAKLRLDGQSYSFSGELSVTGAAVKTIQRRGLSPLTLQLDLGLTNGPLTGAISDGTWTADLVADAAVYSKTNPAPQAGKYTLLIPGSENASAQPGGNGFGAVTVSDSGNVTFSGILGDGTPVTSTSIVSSEGQWPFYASLYGGKGSILGWLSFTNSGVISGQTGWFKLPQAAAKLYPGGFTNSAGVMGSVYQYTNGFPVLGFSEGQLSLTNGNLAQSITNQIGLGPEMQASDQSAGKQSADKLAFNTSSGLFKGSVTNPETGKPIAVNGVVLQNQNFGAGFFLGTTESGSVLLSPTQ
jgi:hypothetical protein